METNKKQYVGYGSIKKFDSGGEVLNIIIKQDKTIVDDRGNIRLSVGVRREPDKYGNTHAVWLNTYKSSKTSVINKDQDGYDFE